MTYQGVKKLPIYLIAITIVILGLFIFTPPDSLITFKAVSSIMLALAWACALLFAALILYKWYKRYKWKKKSVELANNADECYKFYFTEERIFFEGPKYKTEFTWDHYTYWIENNNTIFIFPGSNLYEALYFSVRDLGLENYCKFKSIASSKLEQLSG